MKFETRRKLFHVGFGAAVFILVAIDRFPLFAAVGLFGAGVILSLVARQYTIPVIDMFLDWFEREEHRETFPGKGVLFSLAGMITVIGLFPKPVALAALIGHVVGDPLSHIIGKRYGTVDNPLNPEKDVEGFLAGFAATALLSAVFLHPVTALLAAFAGMVVEALRLDPYLDDNLTVPVVVGGTAVAVQAYLLPLL